MEEKLIVKDSAIKGRGVFASKNMKKGETVCFMAGKEISIEQVKEGYENQDVKENYPLQVGEETYISMNHPYDYINHSCDANCAIIEKNKLVAVKNIEKGEEITYDYSLTEWTNDELWGDEYEDSWTMECKCKCGAKNCRGIIGEFDKLPEKMQKEKVNAGVVQDFIMRKYKFAL